ncbi:hypothetical protein, partial [Streptomyces sp. IB201691-2A2]|uniref:hypothetical protein n=1 Tax=Streptomyces sp. IB201691-2A2 TaxID=2561920 RepID=UPI001CA7A443
MRQLTGSLTVRQLEDQFGQGRTQWSEFRLGRKLLPSFLLDPLVTELVRNTELREAKRKEGRKLLHVAEQAALGKRQLPPLKHPGSAVELQVRLDEARRGQLKAQEALMGTTRIIYGLLAMVTSLQDRCTRLETERDRAATQARSQALAQLGHQLTESQQRMQQAEERLAQARREREEAECLRIAAQERAEQHRRALDDLHRQQQAPSSSAGNPVIEPETTEPDGLVPLFEYDHALELADKDLAAQAAQLSDLREQIGLPPREDTCPDPSTRIVRGEVM